MKISELKQLVREEIQKVLKDAVVITNESKSGPVLKAEYEKAVKNEQEISSLMLANLEKYKTAKAKGDAKAIKTHTKVAGVLSLQKKEAALAVKKSYDAYDLKISGLHHDAELEITESSMNDPVLIAMRAAKEKRAIELAKAKNKRKPLYGKERSEAQDMLWDISQDLKGLYSDRKQVLIDMDSEAGQKGDAWSDKDANRYGSELNDIDKKIQALLISRSKLEIRLLEAKDMTLKSFND